MSFLATAREACSTRVRPSSDDALHHRRSTFAYRRIRVRPIFAVRRRSVPCPGPVRSRPSCLGIRRIPRRAAASCDVAAQVGRAPVAFVDIAAFENFGFAGGRSRSPSQTIRRPALLVWCSFGHHSVAYTARCSPEPSKLDSRGYHPGSIPCGLGRMTRTHPVVSGGFPDVPSVGEPDGHPSSLRPSWPMNGESSLSGAEVFARVCRSMESRSTGRRRDKSRRRALGLPPWGF
jgi:hypothetical protein